jgi:hypothetical protein
VSRLYDRVLADGCRPVSLADFSTLVDRRTGAGSELELAAANRARLDAGLAPIGPEAWAAHRIRRSGEERRARSSWRLESGELDGLVPIVADEVAAFLLGVWAEGGEVDFAAQLGQIAPPFSRFWVESRSPNPHRFTGWAVVFDVVADDPSGAVRWRLRARLVAELSKGDPVGPLLEAFIDVDADGQLHFDDDLPGVVMAPASPAVIAEDAVAVWNDELKFYLYAALLTVSFLHCKNVDVVEVDPAPALSRKHQRRTGRALSRYVILDIDPMRQVLRRDGQLEQGGLVSALHICRGHFKTFTPDAPLFGRLVGSYWWADHLRGDERAGRREHRYRVRVAGDSLGRPYRPADETPPASPRQRGVDPDCSGRGRVAHARTQNQLAEVVAAAGWVPRSPRPEEPQFDLGWVSDAAVWVCEVKSLTADNEWSQLHTAIGQVIDYAHRLDADRPVRKMIAVETRPVEPHWQDTCAAQQIVLVWPDGFADAVAAG